MKKGNKVIGIMSAVGMFVLILDSETALRGATEGIRICIGTLIPSLFPFLFLSGVMVKSVESEILPFAHHFRKLVCIPAGYEAFLVPAFLGGYPVGAQCAAESYRTGKLSKETTERMLAWCSNAGPAFIFGIVAVKMSEIKQVWLLWIIQILSACITEICVSPPNASFIRNMQHSQRSSDRLSSAMRAMGVICGWVILFKILIAFLERWLLWLLPIWAKVLTVGILELTNGCCMLDSIPNENLRMIMAAGLLSFGGICVLLQTAGVCEGLSLRYYITGKILQAGFSMGLTALYCSGMWWTLVPVCIFPVIWRHFKNRTGISQAAVV